jgi:hypothetical protein
MFWGLLLKNNSVSSRRMGVCMNYLWLKPQAISPYPYGIGRKLM